MLAKARTLAFLLLFPFLAQAEAPLKIGAILPLTGELAEFGKPIQEGMEMALKEVGDSKLQVIYEDDQSMNRSLTVTGAKRLIEVEHVSAIFNIAVNTMSAIAPLLNRSKTIGLVLWDSNDTLLSEGDYVFGFGYSTEPAGQKMAEYAYNELKLRNMAVIGAEDEWSEIISASFVKRFGELGGKISMHERVSIETTDLHPLIMRAKQLRAEGMYAPLIGRSLTSWISQSKELKFAGARMTGDGLGEEECKQVGAAKSDGLLATQMWITDKDFQARAKSEGVTSAIKLGFVALGYDAIRCIVQQAATTSNFSGEEARKALKSGPCVGVGGVADFSKGQLSSRREALLRVEQGSFQKVD